MESNWAADHLQVIRTLMERSAVYRRALAPVMILNGALGLLGALAGRIGGVSAPRTFIIYWAGVAGVALAGSYFLVRRQALKASEPFWSPPTRRVTQAMSPALVLGAALGVIGWMWSGGMYAAATSIALLWLPPAWVALYGCAFHAAGFFMPRGMRLFGWAFLAAGCLLLMVGAPASWSRATSGHLVMGWFFGVLHLAYGYYLFRTEARRSAPPE